MGPGRVVSKEILKLAIPHDPCTSFTGIPKNREVHFTVHEDPHVVGLYKFISVPTEVKPYHLNVKPGQFEKDKYVRSIVNIELTGYLMGKNIILTEPVSFHFGNELPPETNLYRILPATDKADLKITSRYENAIQGMNYDETLPRTSDSPVKSSRFYPILPPDGFNTFTGTFRISPVSGWTNIEKLESENGQTFMTAVMLIEKGPEIKHVQIRFVVSKEPDHIKVLGIDKMEYPS